MPGLCWLWPISATPAAQPTGLAVASLPRALVTARHPLRAEAVRKGGDEDHTVVSQRKNKGCSALKESQLSDVTSGENTSCLKSIDCAFDGTWKIIDHHWQPPAAGPGRMRTGRSTMNPAASTPPSPAPAKQTGRPCS